jgi:hypothetical protein
MMSRCRLGIDVMAPRRLGIDVLHAMLAGRVNAGCRLIGSRAHLAEVSQGTRSAFA